MDGQTEGRIDQQTNKGDYYGPHLVNPGSQNRDESDQMGSLSSEMSILARTLENIKKYSKTCLRQTHSLKPTPG